MTVDTTIVGGTLATPDGMREASLAIDDGEIVAVAAEAQLPDANETIDATDLVVLPGVVDPHFHIDEVPDNRAGTYAAETKAAAVGGITTLIDFAWQGGDREAMDPDADLLDGIRHKRKKGETAVVDFSVHGALTRENPEELSDVARAVEEGVTSFKMFMSTYSVGLSNGFINLAMEAIAAEDAVALVHTEDPSVCAHLEDRLRREGKGDAEWYPDSRPDYAEAMGANAAVRMAIEAGTNYYGVHTTCRKSLEEIHRFQEDGAPVRAETCTHYTALDRTHHEAYGNLPKIAPPLRTEDDIESVFEHLADGTLSVVSTDHSVYHQATKETENWWDAPFGANSAQHSLSVFHDAACVKRDFSLPFLVRTMCRNPARTFGMPNKGTLEPGTDADIVLFDPTETYTVDEAENFSNSTFSIYDGLELTGRVKTTLVRGTVVADNGTVVADPGHGQFIERTIPDWSA
ncbi:MAG: amidohydrolase family protein [Halobacteriales archaeon]|nr:amidohydrolase family protein [Halobacteriales archaeon]